MFSGCFYSHFLYSIFSKYVFIRRLGSKLFSMFLPLSVVSALEGTTAIAKPYITICFLSIKANVAFCVF